MPVELIGKPPEPGATFRWDNYHKTGFSTLKKRFSLRSAELDPGRKDIAEGARAVRDWLLEAQAEGVPVRPVGGAWSPSNIQTVEDGWMLNTRRFNRCFRVAPGDLAQEAKIGAADLLLVEAGVQIDEINDKLESKEMRRSLRSTGASNGQTLAGACATGTHGSVLKAGGIQDHIEAMQIVTPGGIYWIEKAALMSDAFIAETGSTETRRGDDVFDAALVAVGSLGIVTAMVIRTVPIYLLRTYLKLIDFSSDDLAALARGDYPAFSRKHGPAKNRKGEPYGDPYFVMVVCNPHAPFRRKATVRLYYEEDWRDDHEPPEDKGELGQGYDSFTLLGWVLRNFPWARGWLVQTIMTLAVGKNGKGVAEPVYATWGETTETHKPLAKIFTGALFCERAKLPKAFPLACEAFTKAGGSTAVTLRFMKGGSGLLSPARWDDTAGIDFDGPDNPKTREAYRSVAAALDGEKIAFTRHWGKFNDLDATRVAADYGTDWTRWKEVQDDLLPNPDRRLFATPVLDSLGLTV